MLWKLVVPGPIEDVDELRVLEWQGDVGRRYDKGALIVELETHKAVVEVRAGQPGILRRVLCEAGSWEKIGQPLAILGDDSEEPLPQSTESLPPWMVDFEIT
jgi:pyruvate/2-oxoglutarate dehydrogenase complex dihydrolipoamide acyltransferase (E2) component